MIIEQLYPERRSVDVADAYGELELSALAPPERPCVIANMVASVDGRASLEGRSGALAGEADKQIFLDLRTQVDAVMAGTATIAIESYGPLIKSEERRRQRSERGLEPVPLAVTATRSMELPVQAPLFQDPDTRIVVLTSSAREAPPCPARVVVERIEGEPLDLAEGMRRLRERHGVRSLLLEGGPTLLAAMLDAGVVDELFLTLSPLLAGSADEPTILEGSSLRGPRKLALRSVLEHSGFLFLRYRL